MRVAAGARAAIVLVALAPLHATAAPARDTSAPTCPAWVIPKCDSALAAFVGGGREARWFTRDSIGCTALTARSTSCLIGSDWFKRWGRRVVAAPRGLVFGWSVDYHWAVPGKPWASGRACIAVDTAGVVLAVNGFESCAAHPERCSFAIDADRARAIAAKKGLAKGTAPWRARFGWDPRSAKLVWYVENTLQGKDSSSGGGEIILIDAHSGAVDGHQAWETVP